MLGSVGRVAEGAGLARGGVRPRLRLVLPSELLLTRLPELRLTLLPELLAELRLALASELLVTLLLAVSLLLTLLRELRLVLSGELRLLSLLGELRLGIGLGTRLLPIGLRGPLVARPVRLRGVVRSRGQRGKRGGGSVLGRGVLGRDVLGGSVRRLVGMPAGSVPGVLALERLRGEQPLAVAVRRGLLGVALPGPDGRGRAGRQDGERVHQGDRGEGEGGHAGQQVLDDAPAARAAAEEHADEADEPEERGDRERGDGDEVHETGTRGRLAEPGDEHDGAERERQGERRGQRAERAGRLGAERPFSEDQRHDRDQNLCANNRKHDQRRRLAEPSGLDFHHNYPPMGPYGIRSFAHLPTSRTPDPTTSLITQAPYESHSTLSTSP